jgi:hypothetical protein
MWVFRFDDCAATTLEIGPMMKRIRSTGLRMPGTGAVGVVRGEVSKDKDGRRCSTNLDAQSYDVQVIAVTSFGKG